MKTQHTPGPWIKNIVPTRTGLTTVINVGIERVCTMSDGLPPAQVEANAKLIAAVPEMFNVLKATLYDLRNDPENESGWIEQAKEQILNVLIQAGHDWRNANEKEVSA